MYSRSEEHRKTFKSKFLTGAMIRDYDQFLHSDVQVDAFMMLSALIVKLQSLGSRTRTNS